MCATGVRLRSPVLLLFRDEMRSHWWLKADASGTPRFRCEKSRAQAAIVSAAIGVVAAGVTIAASAAKTSTTSAP